VLGSGGVATTLVSGGAAVGIAEDPKLPPFKGE
jgi:hypothetical protein